LMGGETGNGAKTRDCVFKTRQHKPWATRSREFRKKLLGRSNVVFRAGGPGPCGKKLGPRGGG